MANAFSVVNKNGHRQGGPRPNTGRPPRSVVGILKGTDYIIGLKVDPELYRRLKIQASKDDVPFKVLVLHCLKAGATLLVDK